MELSLAMEHVKGNIGSFAIAKLGRPDLLTTLTPECAIKELKIKNNNHLSIIMPSLGNHV